MQLLLNRLLHLQLRGLLLGKLLGKVLRRLPRGLTFYACLLHTLLQSLLHLLLRADALATFDAEDLLLRLLLALLLLSLSGALLLQDDRLLRVAGLVEIDACLCAVPVCLRLLLALAGIASCLAGLVRLFGFVEVNACLCRIPRAFTACRLAHGLGRDGLACLRLGLICRPISREDIRPALGWRAFDCFAFEVPEACVLRPRLLLLLGLLLLLPLLLIRCTETLCLLHIFLAVDQQVEVAIIREQAHRVRPIERSFAVIRLFGCLAAMHEIRFDIDDGAGDRLQTFATRPLLHLLLVLELLALLLLLLLLLPLQFVSPLLHLLSLLVELLLGLLLLGWLLRVRLSLDANRTEADGSCDE